MAFLQSFFRKQFNPNPCWDVVAAVVIAVLLGVAVYLSLIFYTHHGNMVTVPNVVGKDYKEAKELLEDAGLRVLVTDTGYETKRDPDLILYQHIPAGQIVKFNRQVFLTINAGHPRMKPLPEVIDGSARSAEMKLKAMGFKIGKRKLVPGDEDLVMQVEVGGRVVKEGDRISVEDPIVLVVGNGDVVETYNGNDSLDWAFQRQFEEEEAKKEAKERELRERERERRRAEESKDMEHDGKEGTAHSTIAPVHSVQGEKIGPPRRSEDLFN